MAGDVPTEPTPGGQPYLGSDAQHLQGRRHIEVLGNLDVTEVSEGGSAPYAQVVEVEDGEVARQGDDDGLAGILLQGILGAVLVGHHSTAGVR